MKLSIDGEMALKRALRQRDAQLLRLCLSVEPAKEVLTSAVNETSLNLSAKEECARLMRWALGRELSSRRSSAKGASLPRPRRSESMRCGVAQHETR